MIKPYFKYKDDIEDDCIITSYYRYSAILQFLYNIEKLAPEVLDDLKEILPIMEAAYNTQKKLKYPVISFQIADFKYLYSSVEPEYKKLKDAIINWALKYNLVDKKLSNQIYINVALWALYEALEYNKDYVCLSDKILYESGKDDERLENILKYDGNIHEINSIFPFLFAPSNYYHIEDENIEENLKNPVSYELPCLYDCAKYNYEKLKKDIKYTNIPEFEFYLMEDTDWANSGNPIAWDPREETWDEFEEKIDGLYERYKEAYRKRTEEFFKQNGYVKGKEKYEDSHFEWFVRYQVQGWSKEKIAREYHVTRQSVTNAINEIGDLVGLKPRPASKGGRPKKG